MSFEIKYDKNGNVTTPPPVVQEEPQAPQITNPMLAAVQEPDEWPTEPEVQEDIVEELPEEVHAAPQAKNPEVKSSWSELREAKWRAEKERDEAMRLLQEAQARQQQTQPEEDYNVNLNDDDLAEGRHISKVQKEVRNLKKQLSDYQTQMQQMTLEARIKAQYPDFDAIVSQQNIAALNQAEPELAMSIGANRDLYSQAVSAYKAIKRMGIASDVANVDQSQVERVKRNSAKPRTASSVSAQSDSPLSRANSFVDGKMSKEMQNKLYREMLESAKRS